MQNSCPQGPVSLDRSVDPGHLCTWGRNPWIRGVSSEMMRPNRDLCGHQDTPLQAPLFERAAKGRHASSEPRYGAARRINGSAARARMPTMRWQATLECPRTRTWRPPHSSLRRALVLSTPDRIRNRTVSGSTWPIARRARASRSRSSLRSLSRRGLTSRSEHGQDVRSSGRSPWHHRPRP